MGCDSLISTGDSKSSRVCKIYRFPGALVAFSGIMTVSHVLEELSQSKRVKNNFSISTVEDARNFSKIVFRYLRDDFSHTNSESLLSEATYLLILTKNAMYQVDTSLSCISSTESLAIGSGQEPARSVMWALWDMDVSTKKIAEKALEAACHFNVFCDKPLHVLEVTDPPPKKRKKKKMVKKRKADEPGE
jgi:ATP-dependent protease HslVU (ClpYQ) peptidase subunit